MVYHSLQLALQNECIAHTNDIHLAIFKIHQSPSKVIVFHYDH